MDYVGIVGIIMGLINVITFIFPLQYAIIVIVGLFAKRRTFPKADEKLKYGVIICARNEEKVIGNLIKSIRKCDYPQDKLDIFVVAHNCTDNTAEVARQSDSIDGHLVVYEYNNDQERTKGYALKEVFKCIENDFGIQNYAGYHIFDADNVLDSEYFNKMNDAFVANEQKNAVMSFRNAKNFGTNWVTACYGILYVASCALESKGRMALNCSGRIFGSGFLVSSEMVKNGWNTVILSEDTDFAIEQALKGSKVVYCDDAMYYDEHPTAIKAMLRQRLRWEKGNMIVCKIRLGEILKTIFGPKKTRNFEGEEVKWFRWSASSLISTILPIGIIGCITTLINVILLAFAPLFGLDAGVGFANWAISFAIGAVLGYFNLMLSAIICYIKERKRIKNVSMGVKIASVFLWPIFALLMVPLQIIALFTKKLTWTPIDHKDTANHESFNNQEVLKQELLQEDIKENS